MAESDLALTIPLTSRLQLEIDTGVVFKLVRLDDMTRLCLANPAHTGRPSFMRLSLYVQSVSILGESNGHSFIHKFSQCGNAVLVEVNNSLETFVLGQLFMEVVVEIFRIDQSLHPDSGQRFEEGGGVEILGCSDERRILS
jgi:hypothetical protein